jgi:hypothetical protein
MGEWRCRYTNLNLSISLVMAGVTPLAGARDGHRPDLEKRRSILSAGNGIRMRLPSSP